MALFKCKMCGAELNVEEKKAVVECEFCGSKQTLPTVYDENLQGLFNRANALRLRNEFDKAESIYEKILQLDDKQADAYWGIILCKYGIEYVEDPKTFKRIPTCHRTSFDAIITDDNYKSAIKYAEAGQKEVYERDAKLIDQIQKDILAIAQNEKPYDVFICYKETDETGTRTRDSVIANDIYYQLTKEGFKVFYAAITLEDKLGSAYEPIIFAALNSSKVMLAVGTKQEYFNAVWVRNEWSRFLKMMKKDKNKVLIPCYRDMDAYDLPSEFAHLQAQDMGKIGFINDVVRGVRKIVNNEDSTAEINVVSAPTGNVQNFLRRAQIALDDADFASADKFIDDALNTDPECAKAYLMKLFAEFKVSSMEGLVKQEKDFSTSKNYKNAARFADDDFKKEIGELYNPWQYNRASELKKARKYQEAINRFTEIHEYLDSEQKAEQCVKLEKRRKKIRKITALTIMSVISLIMAIIIAINVASCVQRNGVVYERVDGKCIVKSVDGRATEVKVLSEYYGMPVSEIGEYAFYNCDGLTSIELPNTIKTIGEYAFYNCDGLTSIVLPSSVQIIGDSALRRCDNLTGIEIPSSTVLIGELAFDGCSQLSAVIIGSEVKIIGEGAFWECLSLEKISYMGTVEEWHEIQKCAYWNYSVPATKVICSDGVVVL